MYLYEQLNARQHFHRPAYFLEYISTNLYLLCKFGCWDLEIWRGVSIVSFVEHFLVTTTGNTTFSLISALLQTNGDLLILKYRLLVLSSDPRNPLCICTQNLLDLLDAGE